MRNAGFRFTAVVVAALAAATSGMAANTRSWVSNTGLDTNACTIGSPCKTFARAVSVTSAGGEVDVLSPGDYGPAAIETAMTIDGGDMAYIQIAGNTTGIYVHAGATDRVVVRNLSIQCAPAATGVYWNSGAVLHLENVAILGGQNGIYAAASANVSGGPHLFASHVSIQAVGVWAVNLSGGTSFIGAVLDHVAIDGSGNGAITITQGQAVVTHSSVANTTSYAVVAGSGGYLDIEDSTIAFTAAGLVANASDATIRIAGNNIHDNAKGLLTTSGGKILTFGTNRMAGNNGFDTPTGTVALK